MTLTPARTRKELYDSQQIESGLTALALCNGSSRLASERLALEGIEIPFTTLQSWKTHIHKDRYLEIEKNVQNEVWARTARHWRRVIEKAADATAQAVDAASNAITAKESKDAAQYATAAQRLSLAGGISHDKAAAADGRPSLITENRSLTELARGLSRYAGVLKVNAESIESTATELPVAGTSPRTYSDQATRVPTPSSESPSQ